MYRWNFYNLVKITWENPLEIWQKYARKFFIRPKIKFEFCQRYQHLESPAKILEIYGIGLGWKNKYGNLEYESNPYIEVTLFGHITFHINFVAPDYNKKEMLYICYWEGMLSMMNNVNVITGELKKPEEDALYDAYVGNKWIENYKEKNEYTKTIRPFLKPFGNLILNIKIREAEKNQEK